MIPAFALVLLGLLCASAASENSYAPTILITGANRGIGKQMSTDLAEEGNRVIMSCRNPSLCEEAVEDVREKTGGDIEMLILDVTNETSIANAVEAVQEADETIDVLVNNAGIFVERYENRSEWTEEDFNKTLDTNFKGAVQVTLALAPYLAPNSSVLMVSSGFSKRKFLVDPYYLECVNTAENLSELYMNCKVFRPESPMANETGPAYKISKVMLNKAVEFLSSDDFFKARGIRINAGNPGTTNTRMAPGAEKTVEEGAESLNWIVRIGLETLDQGFTGGYYDQNQEELEW